MKPIHYTEDQVQQLRLDIAKELKLTIKKISYYNSRNGEGMHCNLYINNKKVGWVEDEGRGGSYKFRASNTLLSGDEDELRENDRVLNEYRAHVNNYPQFSQDDRFTGKPEISSHDFEDIIIALEEEYRARKEARKGIFYKDKGGTTKFVSWKTGNLTKVKKVHGVMLIQRKYWSLKEEGHTVLYEDVLQELGVVTE